MSGKEDIKISQLSAAKRAIFDKWKRGELLDAELAYWKLQLVGASTVLELPTDHPRPPIQTYQSAQHSFLLSPTLLKDLKALSQQENATLFMTLLAAFAILLYRYSGQEDILVGTPIANRNLTGSEDRIGLFSNTLVLRANLAGNPGFRQFLGRVRTMVQDAYAHQFMPFEQLVEAIQQERDSSRSPLCQIMFVLQSTLPSQTVPGMGMSSVPIEHGTSRFDLALEVRETEQGLSGVMKYATDLFEADTIRRLIGHWQTILDAIIMHPDWPLADLPLLTPLECQQLLSEWNATFSKYPSICVHQIFETQAERIPTDVAVTFAGNDLTYGTLNQQANQLAHYLQKLGVGPDVPVGICMERSLAMLVGLLGILKAGGAYVPLDPAYPQQRLSFMLTDVQVPVLLTQEHLAANLPKINARVICLDTERNVIARESCANPVSGVTGENLCYTIYTSGSTGRPKGVQITHQAVVNLLTCAGQQLKLAGSDILLAVTTLSFDLATLELFLPLITGARVVLISREVAADGMRLLEQLDISMATVMQATPTTWQLLLAAGWQGTPHLKIICGGEALSRDLAQQLMARGEGLWNIYGPSETTIWSTTSHVNKEDKIISIGRPLANTQIYLLDAHLQPVPVGIPGELYIGGDGLARGYINRPDLTSERFIPNPFSSSPGTRLYRTGDLARYLPNGTIEYLRRIDQQVKLRGFRIELREIETILNQHPAVEQSVVILREDENRDKQLVAYVVISKGDFSLDVPLSATLRRSLQSHLPDYMLPSAFVFLDALPLTPNGKVDRRGLPAPDISRSNMESAFVAPRTPIEKMLTIIWSDLLKVLQVGINDNFFALGGHSLLVTQLMYWVRHTFQVDLPLNTLFEAPTIADLAHVIAKSKAIPAESAAPIAQFPTIVSDPEQQYRPFPLTDIQQAYWVGRTSTLELGNVSTHVYQEVEVHTLDLERFAGAVRRLIDRHDMLRAIILPDGQQQILAHVPPYQLQILDLRGFAPEVVEAQLAAVRQEMSNQMLPADQWPLFELRASLLDDQLVRLHINTDALIIDAGSIQILTSELLQLYRNPEAHLPPLEISFRDYVMAALAFRASETYKSSEAYWLQREQALPPAPELPLAKDPGLLMQPHFVCRHGSLEPESWSKLKSRAARAGLTPSGLLLAAYAEVLATWSKNPHFTINLTIFNRLPLHPQVNDIVGDFTSNILLEVNNTVSEPFEIRARRLQKQLWDDLDHRYVSGVYVLRRLSRNNGGISKSLIPVVFTSLLTLDRDISGQETLPVSGQRRSEYIISQTPQVWLDLKVTEQDGRLNYNWDAVEDLFPRGMLDDMFVAYGAFLQSLAHEKESWQQNMHSLIPQVQLEQRAHINATDQPVSTELLHALFAVQASSRAKQSAVISSRGTLTYGELSEYSRRLGHLLRQEGARPNILIAVVMEKGWEQVVATLGILFSGAAYLPIDPGLPTERLHHLLQNGQVQVVLTQSWLDAQLTWPEHVRRYSIDLQDLAKLDPLPLDTWQSQDDLAYVIYTSGSTGQPKGVMISHRSAVNTILDINQRFAVGPADRVLALSALNFDLSVYDIFGTLAAGGTIILPDTSALRDPSSWACLLSQAQVTVWNSVPALMEMLVDYAGNQLPAILHSLRLVLLSGDWIPVNLPARIQTQAHHIQVISLGGATEASIWSIFYPITTIDPAWRSIPYGKPLVNQQLHVLDEALEPRPVWVPGEIYISGVGLATGYWRDERRTTERFIIHPSTKERLYQTGDLGRYLPDGNIEFLGREDFQIKLQGHRIELGEIETIVQQHPDVRSVVVLAQGEQSNKRLVAYVVPLHRELTSNELRSYLQKKLPNYMLPSRLVLLDALPLTPNGKIDRGLLPNLVPSILEPQTQQEAKTTRATYTEHITRLVSSILKVDTIEPDSDLFELGATSIDMIRIINLLGKELDFQPRIDEFYRSSTIAWLVAAYEEASQRPVAVEKKGKQERSIDIEVLVGAIQPIFDPEERTAFKKQQPGLRSEDTNRPSFQLTTSQTDEEFRTAYTRRRSNRRFVDQPIPLAQFSEFMSCLRQVTLDGEPRYLYPSAGGMYPVQTYLYIKPGRVESLSAGIYYYHPVEHCLVLLSPKDDTYIDRSIHEWINQPVFDASAFSLFLVNQLRAIVPLYEEDGVRFALLEAGYMSQLLMNSASSCHIGLCPIGRLDFDRIRHLFALEDSHVLMHSLLGGLIDTNVDRYYESFQEAYPSITSTADGREEVEL